MTTVKNTEGLTKNASPVSTQRCSYRTPTTGLPKQMRTKLTRSANNLQAEVAYIEDSATAPFQATNHIISTFNRKICISSFFFLPLPPLLPKKRTFLTENTSNYNEKDVPTKQTQKNKQTRIPY